MSDFPKNPPCPYWEDGKHCFSVPVIPWSGSYRLATDPKTHKLIKRCKCGTTVLSVNPSWGED